MRQLIILLLLLPLLSAVNSSGTTYSVAAFQTSSQGTNNATGSTYAANVALYFLPITENASGSVYRGEIPLIPSSANNSNNLNIVSFSISRSAPTVGDTVDFILTVTNSGNAVSSFQANIFIYDSSNALVDTLSFPNSNIAGGETQVLTQSWSTVGRSIGSYNAMSNATFNGGVTSTFQVPFTIRVPPSPVAVNNTPTQLVVLQQPPALSVPSQPSSQLRLITLPILKEMLPGESVLVFPSIQNTIQNQLVLSISSFGPSASIAQAVSSFLAPSERVSVPVPLTVPSDAPSGYYTFILNFSTNQTAPLYQPVIVHVLSPTTNQVVRAYRELVVDSELNVSHILLAIYNNGTTPLSQVQVYEQIPPALKSTFDQVSFNTSTSQFIPERGLIGWNLLNLEPGERRVISYEIPYHSQDLQAYAYWPSPQVILTQSISEKPILFEDIKSPTLLAGQQGKLTVILFNSDLLSHKVNVDLLGPADWSSTPSTVSVLIPGRTAVNLSFLINTPSSVNPANYAFNMHLSYDGMTDQKSIFVSVTKPAELIIPPLPSLSNQFISWFSHNVLLVLLLAGAAVSVTAMLVVLHQFLNSPKYDSDRVQSIKDIIKMFK